MSNIKYYYRPVRRSPSLSPWFRDLCTHICTFPYVFEKFQFSCLQHENSLVQHMHVAMSTADCRTEFQCKLPPQNVEII